MWQYSRVDHLGPAAVCVFCNRALRSSKGIVISNGDQEAFSGPNCAKKMLGLPVARLLDVTLFSLLVVSDEAPAESCVDTSKCEARASVPQKSSDLPGTPTTRSPLPPPDRIVQYLMLRCELMKEFQYHKSKLLAEAYESYTTTGSIDEASRKRLAGTIRSAAENYTVFSEENVKRCIGVNHWLHEALEYTKPDRRGFLLSMLDRLHRQWCLSSSQLNAINNWGAGIRKLVHSFPHLDTESFAGIVIPDFMQPRKKQIPR